LWQYAIPVSVFAFCYGRIFHIIRRQSKVISGHIAMTTTSRDQNAGQVQQQVTGVLQQIVSHWVECHKDDDHRCRRIQFYGQLSAAVRGQYGNTNAK